MYTGNFIDQVKIFCKSGDGGSGSLHFRREKFVSKGGFDGGDGGNGGSIFLQGNCKIWTLLHFKYNRHYKAENGLPGKGNRMKGASGQDLVLQVPIGTIVKDKKENLIFEITQERQKKMLLEGGRGGLGNWHFRNALNKTKKYSQPGFTGKEEWICLELKILSDVGIVGFPNAGKSTLLSVLTEAKPKIADYAFTTLVPQLGIVQYKYKQSFIMADIPGIIDGASKGRGIGDRFLRHIERNAVLVFLIPANSRDIVKEYDILLKEISAYNPNMMNKKHILVISKSDLLDNQSLKEKIPIDLHTIFISSHNKKGLEELKEALWKRIKTPDGQKELKAWKRI
ncbi:MAG: GTPase ObgE [Candidatus Walczuchella monophlebidarum]